MKFVGNMARREDPVEGGGAGIETEIVLIAAVEIDFETVKIGGAGEGERAVAIPESGIRRRAEGAAENPGANRSWIGDELGEFFDQGGAVGADGGEEFGMAKGEVKGAIAAHGNTGDGAVGASGASAVVALDERKKFAEEEIFVADVAVTRIDVEAGAGSGRGDEEFVELLFLPGVFDEIPAAGMEEHLLVIAEAVKEIENWKFARLVRVIGGRKKDTVWNGAVKYFAGNGVAFDAAGGGAGNRDAKEVREGKEAKERKRIAPSQKAVRINKWRAMSGDHWKLESLQASCRRTPSG